jgi:site-specific recombinase XerD
MPRNTGQAPYEEHEIRRFRKTNPLGTRARLVFELGLCTGLRMEDLPEVERKAVQSGRISIITEKSRTHVVVPVSKAAQEACAAFEATCRTYQGDAYKPSKYAICTLAGAKIGKRRISGEMRDAYEAAGFKESQRQEHPTDQAPAAPSS